VFPLSQILLTAAVAATGSLFVLLAMGWRAKDLAVGEAVVMALVVGLSVFVWRSAGNVAELNDDPPSQLGWFENRWFSPNDWLCPLVTYLFLSVYAAFRPPSDPARWAKSRALLVAVTLVANVVFI
jgi:hypothetical protein